MRHCRLSVAALSLSSLPRARRRRAGRGWLRMSTLDIPGMLAIPALKRIVKLRGFDMQPPLSRPGAGRPLLPGAARRAHAAASLPVHACSPSPTHSLALLESVPTRRLVHTRAYMYLAYRLDSPGPVPDHRILADDSNLNLAPPPTFISAEIRRGCLGPPDSVQSTRYYRVNST